MKTLREHAEDACDEFIGLLETLQERLKAAKRLEDLDAMRAELMDLQTSSCVDLSKKASEVKGYVTACVNL